MSKTEQFYTDRSNIVGAIAEYIKLCQDVGREWEDELNEVIFEAQDEINIKDKRQLM